MNAPIFGQVEGIPSAEAIAELERGVTIQNYRTLPSQRAIARSGTRTSRHAILAHPCAKKHSHFLDRNSTLVEGKNRQVRRMTAAVAVTQRCGLCV